MGPPAFEGQGVVGANRDAAATAPRGDTAIFIYCWDNLVAETGQGEEGPAAKRSLRDQGWAKVLLPGSLIGSQASQSTPQEPTSLGQGFFIRMNA